MDEEVQTDAWAGGWMPSKMAVAGTETPDFL
jgi:hypothetical protein